MVIDKYDAILILILIAAYIIYKLVERWKENRPCDTCAGFYALSNHACDGCEHYSQYRPVDNETYKRFTCGDERN